MASAVPATPPSALSVTTPTVATQDHSERTPKNSSGSRREAVDRLIRRRVGAGDLPAGGDFPPDEMLGRLRQHQPSEEQPQRDHDMPQLLRGDAGALVHVHAEALLRLLQALARRPSPRAGKGVRHRRSRHVRLSVEGGLSALAHRWLLMCSCDAGPTNRGTEGVRRTSRPGSAVDGQLPHLQPRLADQGVGVVVEPAPTCPPPHAPGFNTHSADG